MANCCPTCGQPIIERQHDAAWLLDLLTNGSPKREVYAGQDGGWYVTHGGGAVHASVVQRLVNQGHIHSVYSDIPDQCYHVGRTLDCARTLAERKKHRKSKNAPKIYVGDPDPQQTPGA